MKKILAILLVLALCMSSIAILASCGDDPQQTDPPHTHTFVEGKCECGETDPNYVPPHTHTFVEGKCECGETDPNYVPPHTHNFVEGKCECGEEDPNYVPPHTHLYIAGKCECGESDPNYAPVAEPEDPNGEMIYWQDFETITGTDNASIIEQLGWVDNVNDQTNEIGGKNGTADSANAVLGPNWVNVGLTTNMSLLSITNGVLKIDNKTNNPNGAYATFLVQKGLELSGMDYTIQYEITYADASDYMWAGLVLNSGSGAIVGASRANLNGTYSRIYQNGRVELLTQNGHAYKTIANEGIVGTVVEAGELCAAIFGEGATTMTEKTLTVRVVYKNVAEETEGALATGIYVYIKKQGAADFTLASYTTTKIAATRVAFVIGGSYDGGMGQANSIIGDLAFGQNTTNHEPIEIDGKTYEAYYTAESDASGIVYLDNIAIWKGTGNIPANKAPHTHTFVEGKCECGESDPNYVPPHTHTFVEGKCECGETDPNYVAPDPTPDPDPTPTPDAEDPNGIMVYYQNFDAITGTDNASILAQLGWIDNVNESPELYTGAQMGQAGNSTDGYATLAPGWANVGLTKNMSLLSVDNGALKIDNKTNNPNGAYATFKIASVELARGVDYTIQYDITYEEATDYMWAGAVLYATDKAFVGASRANISGFFSRVYQSGRVEQMTQNGHAFKTIANTKLAGEAKTAGAVCEAIFGTGATTMQAKTVTVRIVYKNVAEETEGALATGVYVYIKEKGATEFTLASYTSETLDHFTSATVKSEAGNELAFVLGGSFDNDMGTADSIGGDLAFRQNTINAPGTPFVGEDGTEYEGYYKAENDAKGILYLDNIAIWEGTGNIPANKTPVAPVEPAPEETPAA